MRKECRLCAKPHVAPGEAVCIFCYELQRRIALAPAIAEKILEELRGETS